MLNNGIMIFSLDFELFWGVRDKKTLNQYGKNLKGEHKVIPRLLTLFDAYGIHATWAIVGFLFAKDKMTLAKYLPEDKPTYHNVSLNPYLELDTRAIEINDKSYYFASDVVDLIKSYKHQEISSHTFSHYYCLEAGQNCGQFEADLKSAQQIAAEKNIQLRSLVFPRNQYNEDYLDILRSVGIKSYRGNQKSFLYKPRNDDQQSFPIRILRLIDSYLNVSGSHVYDLQKISNDLVNLPASLFLRPYSRRFAFLETLKVIRIKRSMKKAAKAKKIYHLWWHPHNFGMHTEKNFANLCNILQYYQKLNEKYGFESLTMNEVYTKYYA